ncbi:MAG: response regulator, partial [Pirellulales bacterium]
MSVDPNKIKLLVVDDRPENLYAMENILSKLDAELIMAGSGNEALTLTLRHKFALILLDVQMPEMNGYEVATLLRERDVTANIPIIFVTAINNDKTHIFKGYEAGAVDYLSKPIDSVILQAKVKIFLQLHQQNYELAQKNIELAELYQTAYQFVDQVSHEFRTPLTVIREYATIIRDGLTGPVTDQQKEFLDIVSDRTDDLANMVDDMLDVSKLEAGLLSVWRQEIELHDVLCHVRPALEQKASIKKVKLEFTLDEDLPAVYCDAEKIGRVIINLAINAIKFCGEGGCVKIWARHHPANSEILVGVTDNGPGISQENLQIIFERFQQLDGEVKSSSKGFGLGLNIAKELVGLNFGQMNVESEPGNGSTFTFTIPTWNLVELATRYLDRIKGRIEPASHVSILEATLRQPVDGAVSNSVDEFLQYSFRAGDTVIRVSSQQWIVLMACRSGQVDTVIQRIQTTLDEANRNRPDCLQMPKIEIQSKGTWQIETDAKEILRQLLPGHLDNQDEQYAFSSSEAGKYAPPADDTVTEDDQLASSAAQVLIVDDDHELLRGLMFHLQASGYEVITAGDGKAAIDAANQHHP